MDKSKKKYNQITLDERKVIEKLLKSNTPKRQIARLLNRSITTIRKEIKRGTIKQRKEVKTTSKRADVPLYNSEFIYFAETAQNNYEKNRKNCGCKCKAVQCSDFLTYIEKQVKSKHWSLDGAAGYAKKNKLFKNTVTTQTLYN
ncbi:helix-turn-helix domain-containing protein [Massiliimalia massiliensis]|uniref:helix-turn-helix domain-containing protein n=1 Tax=Massiliimalia massiliensis TaxID=1852384 RepID=UPI0009872679|nr:helix-turn-helix domain-containing protein [Massiliimalia massiliensis]